VDGQPAAFHKSGQVERITLPINKNSPAVLGLDTSGLGPL
jgi:hypothetical protein